MRTALHSIMLARRRIVVILNGEAHGDYHKTIAQRDIFAQMLKSGKLTKDSLAAGIEYNPAVQSLQNSYQNLSRTISEKTFFNEIYPQIKSQMSVQEVREMLFQQGEKWREKNDFLKGLVQNSLLVKFFEENSIMTAQLDASELLDEISQARLQKPNAEILLENEPNRVNTAVKAVKNLCQMKNGNLIIPLFIGAAHVNSFASGLLKNFADVPDFRVIKVISASAAFARGHFLSPSVLISKMIRSQFEPSTYPTEEINFIVVERKSKEEGLEDDKFAQILQSAVDFIEGGKAPPPVIAPFEHGSMKANKLAL